LDAYDELGESPIRAHANIHTLSSIFPSLWPFSHSFLNMLYFLATQVESFLLLLTYFCIRVYRHVYHNHSSATGRWTNQRTK
jgi:hypothetical protein